MTIGQVTRAATAAPEILSAVFEKLSPRAQAACAQVCKKWSEVARNELWRDLTDVDPLLKIIIDDDSFYDEDAPISEEIIRLIRDADWLRFRQHAIRVASIEFDEDHSSMSPPSAQGIAFLGLHHRFGTAFTPNVRRIRWAVTTKNSALLMMLFISERLDDLKLEIDLDSEETEDFFICLLHRIPTLKKLHIESDVSPTDIVEPFSQWIQTCPDLEEVHIPRKWQNSSVVDAFRYLPRLVEFGLQWNDLPDEDDAVKVPIPTEEGYFSSLRRLGWSSNIKQAEEFLRLKKCRLQGLTFDCRGQSSEREVTALLTTIATCCPELDNLCLNLTNIPESVDPDGGDIPLLSEIFRPLLACKTLVKLRIHYPSSCILSISDLEDMGVAWPTMTELFLCPDPDVEANYRGTPISSLAHVVTAFPQLQALGIYIDHLEPPDSAGDLLPERQFGCLRELDVGTSPVPNENPIPVGLYLASLFAVGTRPSIQSGVSDVRANEIIGDSDAWVDAWETAEGLVHLALQTKEAFVRRLEGRR